MRGPPAVAEQWHCVPVSPASSGPAGRRGFSKQSGGPFARFDSRRITIFKPGTNFRAEVLVIGDGESRAPLGVVAINDFVRSQRREPISHSARTLKARRTPREEKESAKWMRSVDVAEEALQHRAAIHVMDREADDYTLLSELVGNGRRFVIRGHPERRLERGGEKLQHRLDGASAVFFRSVWLAGRAQPEERHAAPCP